MPEDLYGIGNLGNATVDFPTLHKCNDLCMAQGIAGSFEKAGWEDKRSVNGMVSDGVYAGP